MDSGNGDNSGRFASSKYSCLRRNLHISSFNTFSSSAFSDCNSVRCNSREPLIADCLSVDRRDDEENLLRIVFDLQSDSTEIQRSAAMEIRMLAKNKVENRVQIADAGAIRPLVAQSPDLQIQEMAAAALLNLSLCDKTKDRIVSGGAIQALVLVLKNGTPTAKENAACTILRLANQDDVKAAFGRAGAIPLLVRLLKNGTLRGKKDSTGALYALTTIKDNQVRAIDAGVMRTLVDLMADFESKMVDKAALVTMNLVSASEAQSALVEEDGIPVLVELLEVGTRRQKELVIGILLEVCERSTQNRITVAREGAIPPVIGLIQSETTKAKKKLLAERHSLMMMNPSMSRARDKGQNLVSYMFKDLQAEALIQYLRQPRSMGTGARR